MGNILTSYSIAIGSEYIYFLIPHFKLNKGEMINNDEFLITNERSVDPYDSHVSRCGKNSFRKLWEHEIHSKYDYFW